MDSLWTIIQENWVGTILGLIALAIAVYEMLKWRGPRLCYQFVGQRIVGRRIDPLPPQVTIEFEGQPVDHLSKTEIILWNAGPSALRRTDIPATDPLTIAFRERTILMSEVTKVVRESSNISIDINDDQKRALISFEYLDKGDGALLTFWHDGFDTTPQITGVIIGQRSGVVSMGRFVPSPNPNIPMSTPVGGIEKAAVRYREVTRRIFKHARIVQWFPIVAGIIIIIASLFQYQLKEILPFLYEKNPSQTRMWVGAALGAIYTVPGILFLRLYSRKFPKELIPPQFAAVTTAEDGGDTE